MLFNAALHNRMREYQFLPHGVSAFDIDLFLQDIFTQIQSKLTGLTKKHFGLKFNVCLDVDFEKYSFESQDIHTLNAFFTSESQLVLTKNQVRGQVNLAFNEIAAKYDSFLKQGSGWTLHFINKAILSVGVFKLFKAGCESNPLPPELKKSRGLIKPHLEMDNLCFMYAVVLALSSQFKTKNYDRFTKKDQQLFASLPFYILEFPVSLTGIQQFEKRVSFAINIYGYEFDKINSLKSRRELYPVYISNFIKTRKNTINLLCYQNHFYAIHDLSVLLQRKKQTSSRKTHVCKFCLSTFENVGSFKKHKTLCTEEGQRYRLPKKKSVKEFNSWSHMIQAPFVIYADLESSIAPEEAFNKGKQISFKPHKCISWASVTVCRDNKKFSKAPTLYTGPNSILHLLKHLESEKNRIREVLDTVNYSLELTLDNLKEFNNATKCYICHFPFDFMPTFCKVYDHNHLNGKYRGAACRVCNLAYAKPKQQVVVIFHGLSNYDSHFIVKNLYKYAEDTLKVIPKTTEKYLSFSIDNLIFKDSYQFLSESLATLATNLKDKGDKYFFNLNKYVKNPQQRELLFRKGIFPYNYITDLNILKQKTLPTKDQFFNDLNHSHVTEKEYAHAQLVWEAFKCKSLGDYLEVYLLTDVLLLADVFENFRGNCLKDYELDPAHYFSGAQFTFDAFLLKSQESLELISDVNQYLMFQKMIRGGMSMVCKRFASANHKYLSSYDPQEKSNYLLYIDANNLYGWAMMQHLPCGNFKWREVTEELINQIVDQSVEDVGYILEVDLEYPSCLHDDHNDFPLAPEKIKTKYVNLSPYARYLCDKFNLKCNLNVVKLIPTLAEKKNYVLYYKNLQLYLKLGLKLSKVHNILQFDQKPHMKSYVQFNSAKRAQATNNFDINFFKFLSNSLFGKTMERPENKTQIKFVNNIKSYEKYISKSNFKQSKIINPNLATLQMKYPVYEISKPFYLGAVILELAKYHMYNFHYNVMKKHFKDIQLVYTDTDSFIYEIGDKDIYDSLKKIDHFFDFSNYNKDHLLHSTQFKKVPGYFKDESPQNFITDFVGLKSKMYTFQTENKAITKHAKGVKNYVVQSMITFDNFFSCLFNNEIFSNEFKSIRSVAHSVFTSHQSKNSLSSFDDKRWLVDSVNSFAYGHYKIKEIELLDHNEIYSLLNLQDKNMAYRRRAAMYNYDVSMYRHKVALAKPSDVNVEVLEKKNKPLLYIRNHQGKGFISLEPYELEEIVNNYDVISKLIDECEKVITETNEEKIEELKGNKKSKNSDKIPVLKTGSKRKIIESDEEEEEEEEETKKKSKKNE